MSYIVFGAVLILILGLYFIFKKFFNKYASRILKYVSLVLAGVFFVRYFASTYSVFNDVLHLTINNPFPSPFVCFMTALCVWLAIASVVILSMYPFFKFPIVKNLAKTFCLFSSILNVAFLPFVIYSFTGSYGWSLCGVFIEIETAITLLYSVYIFINDKFFKMSKHEVIELLVALPIILLFSMPPYILRTFFGAVGLYEVKEFELYHRVYLYIAFIILIGLYLLLKKKDKEYIRMALLFISLATLISYCFDYDFSRFVTPTSWPLHLCNTAMFIVPLCLLFRMKRLFYFTLFINVLGAFLAMLMPNYADNSGVFSPGCVRFWLNHIMAFAMPLLIVLLGVYGRPKLRQFIYSMAWFWAYFVFVLFLNAWFTARGTPTDFFFINSDFVASKLGKWAEDLLLIQATLPIGGLKLVFYPVYQLIFFAVYVVLGLGIWFFYAWLFQVQDFYIAVGEKNRKIKLDELALMQKFNEKEVDRCMNKESENKLVVKNVYKSYGNNKFYSVKDASLEVNAGEIFGFLGPNGAGKSTIIKCIVGIQPVSKGTIEINGYDITKQPVKAKAQLGFVPDHYALYEKLTGREYINYIADLYNVSKADRDERLGRYVRLLQMEHAIDNQIRTYSHGMKQKIAIMSALVHNPKLWILDEPLTGLDPTSIYQVKECMKEHARNGNIVFFSSHIIDIVEKLCDRIMIIKKGQIRTSITLDELREKNISLESFYLNIIDSEDDETAVEPVVETKVVDEQPASEFFVDKPSLFKRIKAKFAKNKKDVTADEQSHKTEKYDGVNLEENAVAENISEQVSEPKKKTTKKGTNTTAKANVTSKKVDTTSKKAQTRGAKTVDNSKTVDNEKTLKTADIEKKKVQKISKSTKSSQSDSENVEKSIKTTRKKSTSNK